jgi:hypothetical protein
MAHSDLVVTRNRRARLWIDDDLLEANGIANKIMEATLTVTPRPSTRARVAVEVSVNTGPRVQYGSVFGNGRAAIHNTPHTHRRACARGFIV